MAPSVFVIENHDLLRDGLRRMLSESEYSVVGEARDGRDALKALEAMAQPDLILLDMSMPRMSGATFIEQYRRNHSTPILVLTAHSEEEYVHSALRCGANGYALKDSPMDELLRAIGAVLNGGSYLSPTVGSSVIRGYLAKSNQYQSPTDILTPREREVMDLAADDLPNQEIAETLCISIKTVEKHKSNLLRKLGLKRSSELSRLKGKL